MQYNISADNLIHLMSITGNLIYQTLSIYTGEKIPKSKNYFDIETKFGTGIYTSQSWYIF